MDELTVPTLIMWGAAGELFNVPHQEALRAALPSAGFIAHEGRGHNIHWELAEKDAANLAEFFQK